MTIVFKDAITLVLFHSNQTYISTELCINIETPEMLCGGECVLSEQLSENHDSEQEIPVETLLDKIEFKLEVSLLEVFQMFEPSIESAGDYGVIQTAYLSS